MKIADICESMAGGMELAAGTAIAMCRGAGLKSVNLDQISNHLHDSGHPSDPGMVRKVLDGMDLAPDEDGNVSLDGDPGGGFEEPMPMADEGGEGEFDPAFDAEGAEGGMASPGMEMGGGMSEMPQGLDVDVQDFSSRGRSVTDMAHKQMHRGFGSRGR